MGAFMYDNVPVKLMEMLFKLLESENRIRVKIEPDRIADRICRNRWTFRWELEDMLICSDSRCQQLDMDDLATVFELPLRWVYSVPRFETTEPSGSRGIAAIDAAALCIHLEALGFDTQPRVLVDRLKPLINSDPNANVSDSELMVLRYERERLRSIRRLKADSVDREGEWATRRLKGPEGRRIELTRVGGVAYRLDVKGPKYRPPKDRTYIKCPECHAEYLPGDKESSLRHRSDHAMRMRVFDPKPTPAFRRRLATMADPEVVHPGSPLWMHKAVYLRAMYFRREFGYSFIQWDGTDTSKNKHEEARGHLFTSHERGAEGTIIGGCAFWRDPGGWRMQWVWLCPPARRSGALSRRWKDLLERYGDFELDQPLSEAMQAFIAIHGTAKQRAAAGLA